MSLNYPPGVTGNEPQIAGYPERDITIEIEACGHELDQIGNVCPWGGRVDATEYRIDRSTVQIEWTCPACGAAHDYEETVDDGPDPDDERERRFWDE